VGPVQHRLLIRLLSLFVALDLGAGVVALYARGGTASAAATRPRLAHAAKGTGAGGTDPGTDSGGILAGGSFRNRRGSGAPSTGTGVSGPSEPAGGNTATSGPRASNTTATAPATTERPTTSSSGPAASSTSPPTTAPRTTSPAGGPPGSSKAPPGASSGTSGAGSDAGSVVVDDPAGDTVIDGTSETKPEGRADIVGSQAINRAGHVALSLRVAQPVDPKADARWKSDSTFIAWEVDTNGDGAPDYEIQFFRDDDSYGASVGRPGDAAGEPVCDAEASYGPDGYTVLFESRCLGDPASFSYRASIYYDTDPEDENADVLFDVTPNGGLSRPVKRS
jgi:hypothetical protein